ncbi:MAG: hypothetical protein B6I18_05725, partial [Bacteroidetes bacterium 4572_112]
MSKTNNIDNIAEGLDNAPILAKLQAQNGLGLPYGYFDKLENDIMSQIDTMPIEQESRFSIKRTLYYAAAASVAVLIGFMVFNSIGNKSDNDFIAEDNQNVEAPITIDNNKHVIANETPNNSVENNREINNIEAVDAKQDVVIANNNAPVVKNIDNNINGEKPQISPQITPEIESNNDTHDEFIADN